MKIMAVDYGDARTGLAVCDRTEFLASPIGIIEEKSLAKVAEKIVYASREYEVGMIVIGLPKNMDGSEGPRAQKSHKLADTLRAIVPIPVELWDERQTTVSAANILSENGTYGKRRKDVLDAVACGVIKPHVWRSYALADVAVAHADLEQGRSQGAIILVP